VGAHRLAPRIQDHHELDFDVTLFSHYLIENPLNPSVFGSWIKSSEDVPTVLTMTVQIAITTVAAPKIGKASLA